MALNLHSQSDCSVYSQFNNSAAAAHTAGIAISKCQISILKNDGEKVQYKLSLHSAVKCAVWCRMRAASETTVAYSSTGTTANPPELQVYLAVLTADRSITFFLEGQRLVSSVRLPFAADSLFALGIGILIQQCQTRDQSSILHVMLHPLADLCSMIIENDDLFSITKVLASCVSGTGAYLLVQQRETMAILRTDGISKVQGTPHDAGDDRFRASASWFHAVVSSAPKIVPNVLSGILFSVLCRDIQLATSSLAKVFICSSIGMVRIVAAHVSGSMEVHGFALESASTALHSSTTSVDCGDAVVIGNTAFVVQCQPSGVATLLKIDNWADEGEVLLSLEGVNHASLQQINAEWLQLKVIAHDGQEKVIKIEADAAPSVPSGTPASPLLKFNAHKWVYSTTCAGKGLGILTVHGFTGKPAGEVALAAAGAAAIVNAVLGVGDCSPGAAKNDDADGCLSTHKLAPVHHDRRYRSLARMLRSSRPAIIAPDKPQARENELFVHYAQQALFHGRRAMAQTAGRGMFTLATYLPNFTDPIRVPVVTVASRSLPLGNLHTVDISSINTASTGIADWAEFFNGMSTALRLPPLPAVFSGQQLKDGASLIRSWIKSHRYTGVPPDIASIAATTATLQAGFNGTVSSAPISTAGVSSGVVPPNPAHAGLLMGLGSLGYLSCLNATDMLEYLAQTHTTTTIGMLLGLAMSYRGTMDASVHKAIVLHIPNILPGQSTELDIPPLIQACAMIALGILFEGSHNASISEFLVAEMSRPPVSDRAEVEKDSYVAAAAYALGLVQMERGYIPNNVSGIARWLDDNAIGETSITDMLLRFVNGGYDARAARRVSERHKARSTSETISTSSKPELVREAAQINTMLLSGPALLAITLSCLQTNNRTIADALQLPDSLFLLDNLRYDTIMMRVMARSVIMWQDLQHVHYPAPPTFQCKTLLQRVQWETSRREGIHAWFKAQVPSVVRRVMRRLFARAVDASSGGAAAALLAKILGNAKPSGAATASTIAIDPSDGDIEAMDQSSVKIAYWMSIAGACAGLALRFAGSADIAVRDEILSQLSLLVAMKVASAKDDYERCCNATLALYTDAVENARTKLQTLQSSTTQQPLDALLNALIPQHMLNPNGDELLSIFPVENLAERVLQDGPAVKPPKSHAASVMTACTPPSSVLTSALSTVAVSAAIVMAGTCDVGTLRLLRKIRRRVEKSTMYGDFMASGYALGLLGLSAGRATLSTQPSSIAALVALLPPIWPHGSASQVSWPQPGRQLWPHAVEHRLVKTLDEAGEREVFASCVVTLTNGGVWTANTPCLLPAVDDITHFDILCEGKARLRVQQKDIPRVAGKMSAPMVLRLPNSVASAQIPNTSTTSTSFRSAAIALYATRDTGADAAAMEDIATSIQSKGLGADKLTHVLCNTSELCNESTLNSLSKALSGAIQHSRC